VHYLPEVIRKHFGDGSAFGCEIHYLEEEKPLGTGGCLSLIEETLDHPLFVCNGDLVTQVNVEDMLSFHHRGSYAATIGIRTHNTDVPFGVIESTNGRVTAVVEKPTFSHDINSGMYILSPELLARIPRKFYPITDLFDSLLEEKQSVGAFPVDEDWIDVGHRENLDQAQGNYS
jgi:NDP-sugar pyrophosphorylase family protein